MQRVFCSQRVAFKKKLKFQKRFRTVGGAEKAVAWVRRNVYKPKQLQGNF